ncbi:hypothetical protein A2954_07080 [Candidatus Roizmanbacteria bacterium RIFCSPLOWO2_01_FULL_37_12]|uniref:Glycosyltransferase RgtA/B/C/D-like domain-containing protein n=1 Tax=Candidatus Roizmanbacteria bacterium RIFCSPLOWO2_01_FULL_37_12 TaxID=1802056 RepID=A0A1F7IE27_9BACT|nr:MAG: hypothetical protein A3D76_02385 [Candidatus Roizmanbacteria bacterium RIFCSPHIGHO2_02_FULL_37_9b]OGK41615.1 MAG: hypothetical protein A2954_07080 [Candidatus Roizmanbacteria bacterium RIFCSPLOWO2_01_FULL_37_12]
MTKALNTKKILFVLFFLFISIRLPFLDQINLLPDERDIALSGWSIAQTGKDLFGKPFPLVFENISPNNPLFAIYFAAFWFLLIPIKSVFLARLPFVLVSSLLVFVSFQIVKILTNNDKKALLTTIVLCFSPWIFHITRLALDIPLAMVFLFTGILYYLEKRKFSALMLLFLASFTYQGFRLLIPFLLIYLELFFLIKQKSWRYFVFNSLKNLLFVILLVLIASYLEPNISKNRLSEIIFFNNEKNAQAVYFKRITSIASPEIARIFDNKLTVSLEEIFLNFTKGLDLSYLFKNGDYSPINGNASTGQYLFVFIIFYFLGIVYLGKKGASFDTYLLGFIPLGMVPALLSSHGISFSIRGVLSSFGFSYLLSLGIIYFFQLVKDYKFKKFYFLVIGTVFLINLSYFIYGYYQRRPKTVGELFYENERRLSLFLLKKNKPYEIYHQLPQNAFLSYIFFRNDGFDLSRVQNNMFKKNYSYDGLKFKKCNHKVNYLQTANTIIHEPCVEKINYDLLNDINNIKVKNRILYKDFSGKTAYFVIE